MARVARLSQMPLRSIEVNLGARFEKDELIEQRVVGIERNIEVSGPLSEQQLSDLLTAAQNCVVGNTMEGVSVIQAAVEPQEPDADRHDYLPKPGIKMQLETQAHARGLDDLLLVPLRVGGHTLFVDETFTKREKMGCWSVGLLVGALSADTVATVRRAAAEGGIPLKGIEVQSQWEVERELGEGPSFPSSTEEHGTFRGRVATIRPTIRLWGDLGPSELDLLRDAAVAGPVARGLTNPVQVEDHLKLVSEA